MKEKTVYFARAFSAPEEGGILIGFKIWKNGEWHFRANSGRMISVQKDVGNVYRAETETHVYFVKVEL